MQQEQFSQQKFNQALILTNKIKTNLKPFLKQFSEKNIKWIYSSIAILHHNLTHPSVQPITKMNSMFAVKCIVDITQYVSLAFIQTYILPIIKVGAMTDLDVESGSRGHQFFITNNKVDEAVESYGFNYVKVCTELVNVLAVIKPRKLYFDQPTNDLSQFEIANIELKQALKHPSSTLSFFKQTPANLKKNFEANLNLMNEDSEEYERFVQQKFYEQLKTGLSVQPKNLDIIQLIEAGDMYFMDQIVSIASDALQKGKTCNLIRYTLQFLNRLVRSGCKAVALFFHGNDSLKTLVRSAIQIPGDNRKLERGENFFPNKNGTAQQRKQLYIQFLRSLEYWESTYLKNSVKSPQKQSNTSKYYKILKHDYKLEFPQNPNLPKQLKQTEEKLKKNAHRNQIFLEQLRQQEEVKSERSNSVVKGKVSKPKVQSNSFDKLPSISKIKQTPKGDPTYQGCVARLNNVKKTIDNLGKSQKQLPRNIKIIQSEINQIGQDIQNVQGISDQAIQNLMNQYVQLEVRKQKLQPIYEEYKVNKIDFKTFCNKIANPRSSKLIEENEKSRLRMQQKQKQKQLQRQRQAERQKEVERQKQAQRKRQKQIEAQILKQQQNIRQLERQKQIQKKREQERMQEQQRQIQKQIQKRQEAQRQREIQHLREQQSLKQRQSKKSIKNSREHYHQDEVQVSQSSPPQSKLRNSLTNKRNQEIPKFNEGERVTYNQQQQHNNQQDQRVQFSRMGSDISRMSEDNHASPQNLKARGSLYQFPHSKENGEAVSYEPVTINNSPGKYLDPNYEYEKSPIGRISVKNQEQMVEVDVDDDEIIQNPYLKPLDQSYHAIEEVYDQIKGSKNFKDVINSQRLFIKNNKKQAMFWIEAQSGSLIKPVSSSNKRSRVQSSINVPDLLNERSKKYEMQIQLLQKQKNKQILNLQNKLSNIQREKSEVSEKLKLKQYEIKSLKQNSQVGPVKSRVQPQFNIVDDQNYVMKKMLDNKSVSNGNGRKYQGLKIHSRVLAPGEIINTKIYQEYFHCIKNQKDKKRHVKNKQLIYKVDSDIQIGFMGHLEDQMYRLTLYLTPDQDFQLVEYQLGFNSQQLSIKYDLSPNLQIKAKKQQKIHFDIFVKQIPYNMPTFFMKYRLANRKPTTCSIQLPCAYHKFFKIRPLQEEEIVQLESPALIMRGQEIPYSKKLIKNLDIIQQLLPRVEKLNDGRANEFGEVCYGGVCSIGNIVFPIKVCIKPNEFLYIQTVRYEKQKYRQLYESQKYYIATINHLLMKDVQWK